MIRGPETTRKPAESTPAKDYGGTQERLGAYESVLVTDTDRSAWQSPDKRTLVRRFEYQAFIDRALAPTDKTGNGSRHHVFSWCGVDTLDEAIDLATYGYQSVMDEVEGLSADVAHKVIAERLEPAFESTFDVAGSEVEIGRFLSGELECMIESLPIQIAKAGRTVRIAVPVCYSSDVPAATVMRRGAAVVALVDVLARAKHPLEIWATINIHSSRFTKSGPNRLTYAVRCQKADEPLDMGRVMFALAHSAMLRVFGFHAEEHEGKTIRDAFGIGSDYGAPGYAVLASDISTEQTGTTIILPELQSWDIWDTAYAVKWIEEQLTVIFGEEQ